MAVPDEGFKLNLGGHLLEDSGSGITKVFEHVGKKLGHGTVSSDMPVWDHDEGHVGLDPRPLLRRQGRAQEGHQGAARRRRTRSSTTGTTARCASGCCQHTSDQGVIDLWEFLVGARVHDRRLVRPLRPRQPLRAQDALLRDAHGGLLVLARAGLGRPLPGPRTTRSSSTAARCCWARRSRRVIIENDAGEGRHARRATRSCRTSSSRARSLEADAVISTLPVWNVLASCPSRRCRTGTSARSATSPRTSCGSPGSASTSPRASRSHALDPQASSPPGCTRRRRRLVGLLLQPDRDGPDDARPTA